MRKVHWKIDKQGNDVTVTLDGEINETSVFDPLLEELSDATGSITFDLAGVKRLNSTGVRQWVNFMRALAEVEEIKEIFYTRCSVAIVAQVNMIKDFQGPAKVLSIYAPYANEETGDEEERLLEVKDITDPANPPTFEAEEGVWELDEMPERYFAFLTMPD